MVANSDQQETMIDQLVRGIDLLIRARINETTIGMFGNATEAADQAEVASETKAAIKDILKELIPTIEWEPRDVEQGPPVEELDIDREEPTNAA